VRHVVSSHFVNGMCQQCKGAKPDVWLWCNCSTVPRWTTDRHKRESKTNLHIASTYPSFPRCLWCNLVIVRPRKHTSQMKGKMGLQTPQPGGLLKVAKAPVIFATTVLPSFRVYQCGSHWMNLHEIWSWGLRWKHVKKMQICLKSVKNIRNFTRRPKYVVLLAASINCHKSALFEWCGIRQLG
jgi:hypothetical protein